MKLSYYYLDGRYGDYFSKVGYIDTYHAWARMQYAKDYTNESVSAWLPRMVSKVARAYGAGRSIIIGLNMQDPRDAQPRAIKAVLSAMKPYWDKVIAIDIADEPKWGAIKTTTEARRVKRIVGSLGLAKRPVFITYSVNQILKGNAHNAPGLDTVGVEFYLEPPGPTDLRVAATMMEERIKKLLSRVNATKKIVVVGQAYSRNYEWKSIPALVAIQEPIFKAAKDLGTRLVALNLFSYGRPSGTFEYPDLKAEHKRLRRLYP